MRPSHSFWTLCSRCDVTLGRDALDASGQIEDGIHIPRVIILTYDFDYGGEYRMVIPYSCPAIITVSIEQGALFGLICDALSHGQKICKLASNVLGPSF